MSSLLSAVSPAPSKMHGLQYKGYKSCQMVEYFMDE